MPTGNGQFTVTAASRLHNTNYTALSIGLVCYLLLHSRQTKLCTQLSAPAVVECCLRLEESQYTGTVLSARRGYSALIGANFGQPD